MTFEEVENTRKLYEVKRSKIIKKILIIDIFAVIFLLLINFSSDYAMNELGGNPIEIIIFIITILAQVAIISFVIGFFVLLPATKKEIAAYKDAYKSYFVAASLAKVFSNIAYSHAAGLDPIVVRQVMTTADRYSSNDYMTATYKNINFTQADIHTEERRTTVDGDGHIRTYYVTIFKGRFLVFDFNRNFSTNLQVASRHFYGAKLKHSENQLKFERIKTESTEFNKKFRVFAEDGVDALYILDPAFMEKIQKLYTDCHHELLLTFMDKKVYIAIDDGKDSLEPPKNIRKPLDENTEIAKVQQDILTITNFVDSLNLDRYFKEPK